MLTDKDTSPCDHVVQVSVCAKDRRAICNRGKGPDGLAYAVMGS